MKALHWITIIIIALGSYTSVMGQKAEIKGVVVDSKEKKPVLYATIRLLTLKDSTFIAGTITDEIGKFTLKKIPPGNYKLSISFVGFEKKRFHITVPKNKDRMVLGKILLQPKAEMLKELVIKGDRGIYKTE